MLKIAFPTQDGQTISAHLGMAPYFIVATIDGPGGPTFEQRTKAHHGSNEHGHSAESSHQSMHQSMFGSVADCQVLIAGGMGQPAYDHALQLGLAVVMTGEKSIQRALEAYQAGTLTSDPRRVHAHN